VALNTRAGRYGLVFGGHDDRHPVGVDDDSAVGGTPGAATNETQRAADGCARGGECVEHPPRHGTHGAPRISRNPWSAQVSPAVVRFQALDPVPGKNATAGCAPRRPAGELRA